MTLRVVTIMSALFLTAAFNSIAAPNIFMQVPGIDGTAMEESHAKWHPLTSFSWGVERAVEMTDLGSTQRGHANSNFSKIEITRRHDYSMPEFFLLVASGTVLPEVVFHFTRAGDSSAAGLDTYMTITLKHAIIDSLSHSASDDGIAQETLSLAYVGIEIVTKKIDPKTGKLTTAQTASWNVQTGTSEF